MMNPIFRSVKCQLNIPDRESIWWISLSDGEGGIEVHMPKYHLLQASFSFPIGNESLLSRSPVNGG